MYIDFSELEAHQAYITLTQTVIPRPIAWVLSENEDGSYNLAPFSFFNAICGGPPLIMIAVGEKPDGRRKDTWVNIEARKEYVVHIVHRQMLDAMNQSSATLDYGESELDLSGLDTVPMEYTRIPRLKDCRVAFACEHYETKEIGNLPHGIVIGKVRGLYVEDGVVGKDAKDRVKILAEEIDPVGRLGASEYVLFGEKATRVRPA